MEITLSDFENISTHFEYGIKGWIFSARYGYCLNKNFCVGADFSGYYYNLYYSDYSWQILHTENYNFGAFARYSVDKFKKFKPFVESGAYYFIERGWTETPRFGKTNLDKKAVSGYIGFGARFPLFKDRFSLDVMYKYHDIGLEERSHHSVTYRFNFHF